MLRVLAIAAGFLLVLVAPALRTRGTTRGGLRLTVIRRYRTWTPRPR